MITKTAKSLLITRLIMYTHLPTLCNHLIKYVNKTAFEENVGQLNINKGAKKFSAWKCFLGLFVGQVLGSDSIRGLCTTLQAHQQKLYHMGIESCKRSTFSDWLKKVPSELYKNMFISVLQEVQHNLKEHRHIPTDLSRIYAIDATIIPLTLSVFDRALYRKKKGGIKIHTRLDISDALPDLAIITEAKSHEVNHAIDLLAGLKSGDVLVFDRGYLDYDFLYTVEKKGITFVSRTKVSTHYCPIAHNTITDPRIQYDAICEFVHSNAQKSYPTTFRIIRYIDTTDGKMYEYITNNLQASAIEIADFYKMRRTIETLFRRLKQNLKLKQFFGTSRNAVESQVRVALLYYLMVLLIKIKTRAKESLLEITRKFATLLFERTDLLYVIGVAEQIILKPPAKQSSLF